MHDVTTIYVTKNRRSPVVAMFGKWPPRSGLARSCNAGVRLGRRAMTDEEIEDEAVCPRYLAIRWQSIRSMLRDERDAFGDEWFRLLVDRLRENRAGIERCRREIEAKRRKHERVVIESLDGE